MIKRERTEGSCELGEYFSTAIKSPSLLKVTVVSEWEGVSHPLTW